MEKIENNNRGDDVVNLKDGNEDTSKTESKIKDNNSICSDNSNSDTKVN